MATRMVRSLVVLLGLCIALSALPVSAPAGEIVVQPGAFDHFEVKAPQKMTAGESATVEITAVDAFGNVITTFGDTKRDFTVAVTGSATVKPAKLPAALFQRGAASISLGDIIAETLTFSLYETGSTVPLFAKEIVVIPARVSSLSVKAPRLAVAGERFDISLTAIDAFGNVVTEGIPGKAIKVAFRGDADPKTTDPVADFRNGLSGLSVRSEKTGSIIVEVRDAGSGSMGTSDRIDILAAALSAFRVSAPGEIIAGEPFDVGITALDAYKNIIRNYATSGTGVTLASSGKAKPFPSIVSAYEFNQGQAKVTLRYETVEPVHNIILSAAEMSGKGSGLSDAIKVAPQVPTRYVVTTPASAVAGQKFPLKIMVYNQIGNPMKHYNLSGPDVTLIATGSGRLSPSKIPASEFVNGVASVEAQYDRSEAFAITAEPASAVVAPSAPVTRAQPAATPAGKADGKKKPAVATKPAGQKKVAKTKEAVEPKKEAPVADTRKEIITTPAAPTAAKAEPIQVRAITLSETAKRSVVAINVEGLKKHGTTVVKARPLAVSGKNWIVLSITPAVNKIVEPVTFDSDLLGQVVVEEVKNGTPAVIVKIEQKTASKFKVEQTESFITVSVGN